MAYCTNCGQKLEGGGKFCPSCGEPVGGERIIIPQNNESIHEKERFKCPSCGEMLDSFMARCPSCGCEVRGVKASNAVKEFWTSVELFESDEKRASVIRNYPIPNSREDIIEFMILASTNLDIEGGNSGGRKEIADAWIVKMEQCCQKAQMVFANKTEYNEVRKIYDQTQKKLSEAREKAKKRRIYEMIFQNIGIISCAFVIFLSSLLSQLLVAMAFLGVLASIILMVQCILLRRKKIYPREYGIAASACALEFILGMIFDANGYGFFLIFFSVISIIAVLCRYVASRPKEE